MDDDDGGDSRRASFKQAVQTNKQLAQANETLIQIRNQLSGIKAFLILWFAAIPIALAFLYFFMQPKQ